MQQSLYAKEYISIYIYILWDVSFSFTVIFSMMRIFSLLPVSSYYKSLPPVSKAYGTLCMLTTTAYHLGLLNHDSIALIYEAVLSRFQVLASFVVSLL